MRNRVSSLFFEFEDHSKKNFWKTFSTWSLTTKALHMSLKYIHVVRFTCNPFRDGVEEEALEVIIKQLVRSWKDLTVCSVHCLGKAVGKVLDWNEKEVSKSCIGYIFQDKLRTTERIKSGFRQTKTISVVYLTNENRIYSERHEPSWVATYTILYYYYSSILY